MLEATSDPWSHRLSSPSAIHRQGVSIGVTGRVLLPLPLPQNGLASYENHSHNSVTPTPTKVKLCTEEFSTHSLCTPPQMCSFTAKARFVTMLNQIFSSNLIKYSYSLFSMAVGTQQTDILDGEMESLQSLVWEWREEGGR